MTDHRFIAYVTLSDTDMRRVNASTIVARVKQRFGGKISMEIAPRGDDGGILLDIDGTLITALLIDKPLPPGAYARALDLDRVWPEARATLAANRAHVIVATLSPITTHGEALNAAAYVTFVAAAVTDLSRATAIVWATGDAITEAKTFQAAADALCDRQLPVLSWINLDIRRGPPTPRGEPTTTMVTTGLAPFAEREIEFAPSTWPPADIADRVIGTATYLMQRGPVIKDGDTIGQTTTEKIVATTCEPRKLRLKAELAN